MPDCHTITDTLPGLIIANEETKACEDCHPQCVGGCLGGLVCNVVLACA